MQLNRLRRQDQYAINLFSNKRGQLGAQTQGIRTTRFNLCAPLITEFHATMDRKRMPTVETEYEHVLGKRYAVEASANH